MIKKVVIFLFLFTIPLQAQYFESPDWKIPLLFEWPRKGYFTMIPWKDDVFDKTSIQHFFVSYVLAGVGNNIFEALGAKHSMTGAVALTVILGFAKEVEDGYREGFSRMDFCYDLLGVGTWILAKWISDSNKWDNVKVESRSYPGRIEMGLSFAL